MVRSNTAFTPLRLIEYNAEEVLVGTHRVNASGDNMEKILISSCLLGQAVRYDGGHNLLQDEWMQRWQREGRIVAFCPECAGGLHPHQGLRPSVLAI